MPKRRRRDDVKRHTRRKTRFKRSGRLALMHPAASGTLGSTHKQHFRYVDRVTINPTTTVTGSHVFRANGMYDPDATAIGHQPLGFDQLVGVLYNHFTVYYAKIKVTFTSSSNTNITGGAVCAITTDASASTTPSINDVIEKGGATSGVMMVSQGLGKLTLTKSVNISRFLGQDVLQEDQNAGTSASDPGELVYFHVYCAGLDSASDPAAINCLVEIDYYAVLHEKKKLIGSL